MKTTKNTEPRAAREVETALEALIYEAHMSDASLRVRTRRLAALFAIAAVDPRRREHGRAVCLQRARNLLRGPVRATALSARAAQRLDKRIRAACAEAATDGQLPEWVRARAQAFNGFETEAPTRRNR
jgi:hypothetical protein